MFHAQKLKIEHRRNANIFSYIHAHNACGTCKDAKYTRVKMIFRCNTHIYYLDCWYMFEKYMTLIEFEKRYFGLFATRGNVCDLPHLSKINRIHLEQIVDILEK